MNTLKLYKVDNDYAEITDIKLIFDTGCYEKSSKDSTC